MQIDAQNYRFCVAPMMDWTDRYDRFFLRLMSRHARLYTEMVTADAILHGDKARLLDFNAAEHPLALQLGGSNPHKLAQAARIGADWGYDEINFNVGCPSDRVQNGRFGACLMSEPDLVADCLAAMRHAVDIPVTMKCRIGVDEQTPQDALFTLVEKTTAIGIEQISVHARKAWLQGLSPKQNRDIPPLDYPLVYRLKKQFPNLIIVLNGGLATLADALAQLPKVDG
ncbi:MAG: tRNA dihydrouridine(20/20a) synthase DusA, partial [Parvibaculales bacterium]